MIEFYPQVRWLHIAMVVCSGSLFLLRGLLVQAGQSRIAMATPVRWLSYTIDTTLLTAALMLLTILPHGMFANGWLTVKLVLVVAYVVLGVFALRRGRTPRAKRIAYVAALLVFAFIVTVARAHHPLGIFYRWFG